MPRPITYYSRVGKRRFTPAKLISRTVGLSEDTIHSGVVIVRAEECVVVNPQRFSHESDLLLGTRLLDDDVAVTLSHEAGEALELGCSTERCLEALSFHLQYQRQGGKRPVSVLGTCPKHLELIWLV